MTDKVLELEGIWKRYRFKAKRPKTALSEPSIIGDYSNYLAPSDENTKFLWALRDVSFSLKAGEALAVVGPNGGGKTTLLKIIAGITKPTKGRFSFRGRIGALLEAGTGIHPEFTGRENIYMYGSILGMGKKEIEKKFDSIVAFSELEHFLDMPVKYYSTGMQLRLGYSIAAHLDPDILLVDEVLAVGDLNFQLKCIGHIERLQKKGCTIILVSHALSTLQRIAQKGLFLWQGRVRSFASADEVLAQYVNTMNKLRLESIWETASQNVEAKTATDKKPCSICRVYFCDEKDNIIEAPSTGEPVKFCIELEIYQQLESPWISLVVFTENNIAVAHFSTYGVVSFGRKTGKITMECLLNPFPFLPGLYYLKIVVGDTLWGVCDAYGYEEKKDRSIMFYVEASCREDSCSQIQKMLRVGYFESRGLIEYPASWKVKGN